MLLVMVFLSLGVSSFKVCLVAHLSGEFAEQAVKGDDVNVNSDHGRRLKRDRIALGGNTIRRHLRRARQRVSQGRPARSERCGRDGGRLAQHQRGQHLGRGWRQADSRSLMARRVPETGHCGVRTNDGYVISGKRTKTTVGPND